MSVTILHGDVRERLSSLPASTFDCIVTSPPYWGLRSYLPNSHADKHQEIGLEMSPADYVRQLVSVFATARRTLKDDGSLWLNIGDTYNNRRRLRETSHQPSLNGFEQCSWAEASAAGMVRMSYLDDGFKEKDAIGIPWLLAASLRADGWYLRQEIIWRKRFGKPEPTRDRLPCRHEPIFLLTKSKNYHFDRAALPDWANDSVWEIPPTGHDEHGAAFPSKLVEPCVLAGSRIGGHVLDPFAGAGTTGLVADRLGRHATLIELNSEYIGIAKRRIEGDAPLFAEVCA